MRTCESARAGNVRTVLAAAAKRNNLNLDGEGWYMATPRCSLLEHVFARDVVKVESAVTDRRITLSGRILEVQGDAPKPARDMDIHNPS